MAVTRRVLLVAPFAPASDARHGGARAMRGIAAGLAERHEVGLIYAGEERELDRGVRAICSVVEAVAVPADGRSRRRLRAAAGLARGRSQWASSLDVPNMTRHVAALAERWKPDVVQIEGILGDTLRGAARALRVLTVQEPAQLRRESVALRGEGMAFAHRVDAATAEREQRRFLALADAAVVFTDRDRELVARDAPPGLELETIALGWEVPTRALDPAGSTPPSILFVGAFRHPPNVEAAVRLARVILPLVRRERPDVVLELVGASPPEEVLALAGEAVRVSADVPSVAPFLDRATVVVAPLQIGGGMRVKVLEAMAAGKAVVASSRAVAGLSARPGDEIVIADGADETACAIVRLVEDADARVALARAARAWAERELSWSTMAERYDELYERLERRRAHPAPARRSG